jgi:hypothetical protein
MMKTRLALPALLLALLAMVPAAPAAALDWGIGADLGFSIFMPSSDYGDVENISSFGIPFSSFREGELTFVPAAGGLRLSFAGENRMHEAWLGVSLNRISEEDVSITVMQLSGNYQFNFATQGAIQPYLTAGVGLNRASYKGDSDSESGTASYFGGGVGVAHRMGTGRLRAELRYDALSEGTIGDEDDYVVFPKGGAVGFKLGFDLWNK